MQVVAHPRWNPFRALRAYAERRFAAWVARNLPPSTAIRMSQRNVFIFPTRQGFGLALVIGMLIVGAINYQNSLIYLLAFLLGGMFIGCILATFRNLAGIRLQAGKALGCHVGEHAQFELRLEAADLRQHYGLLVGWPDEERLAVDLDLEPLTLSLGVQAHRRGRLRPGRMLIETFHPMGLLRAWSWLDFGAEAIVYPLPKHGPLPLDTRASEASEGQRVQSDGEDLYGLREYRLGDVPRAVAWKHYAATGHLRTKEFSSGVGSYQRWLRWDDLPGVGAEERLQRLTGWVLAAARQDRAYGVRLPGAQFPPAVGDAHRLAVLTAFALFGESSLAANNGALAGAAAEAPTT